LCFRINPNDPERETQYLRTPEVFLGGMINQLSNETPRRRKLDESADTSPVCVEFLKRLTRLKAKSPCEVNYSLVTEVTHQLLRVVRDTDEADRWPTAFIRAAIEEGLPIEYQKSLEARHPELVHGQLGRSPRRETSGPAEKKRFATWPCPDLPYTTWQQKMKPQRILIISSFQPIHIISTAL